MPKKTIIKPAKAAPAVGPYNHAVRIGNLLFCSGQIPLDPATGNLVSGDIKAQAARALENIRAILDDQKLTFANVVKSTVFLTNLGDFAGMNEVCTTFRPNPVTGAILSEEADGTEAPHCCVLEREAD